MSTARVDSPKEVPQSGLLTAPGRSECCRPGLGDDTPIRIEADDQSRMKPVSVDERLLQPVRSREVGGVSRKPETVVPAEPWDYATCGEGRTAASFPRMLGATPG